jgi:4'-phosphopantetheinyl transferase
MQVIGVDPDDPLPDGMEVVRLDFDVNTRAEAFDTWTSITPQEQSRAKRYRSPADRVRFVHTRATLRRLLAERLNCTSLDIIFGIGAHGKPFVEPTSRRPMPCFSVAHSGNHSVIAIADGGTVEEVGVDIEYLDSAIDRDSMAGLIFSAEDRNVINAAAEPITAFYQHWCFKEAVLKAIGAGIGERLLSISMPPEQFGMIHVEAGAATRRHICARVLSAPPGYAAALAWKPCTPTLEHGKHQTASN